MTLAGKEDKIKLFLADDHTIVREGFKRLLSLEDSFDVIGEAEDGKDAVGQVLEIQPDIVLMDIGMPVLNGLEATRRIKENSSDIKILILTAYDNEQYIYRVVQAGAHGYLMKNIDSADLFRAIHSVYRDEYVFPESVRSILEDEIDSLPGNFHSLTDREREILQLIAEGNNHQKIAEKLNISVRTVDTHRNNIIKKLDVHDTANLVLYAIKNGITILPR